MYSLLDQGENLDYIHNTISGQVDICPTATILSSKFEIDVTVEEAINETMGKILELEKLTDISIFGLRWKSEFETNEASFRKDLLVPLLNKMGFLQVEETHGPREYGKDITYGIIDRFDNMTYHAIQAKKGNVNGRADGDILCLVKQIEMAFRMRYKPKSSPGEKRFIQTLIVAISGKYTDNAKDIIGEQIPNYLKGSVYFLDKKSIIDLMK